MIVGLSACVLLDSVTEPGLAPLALGQDLWVLVHPTDAPPEGPGVVQLDEDGVEVARLPLPDGVTSPHGLAFDGTSVWLSDLGADPPSNLRAGPTGRDRSKRPGRMGDRGIALDGDGFWVGGGGPVVRIDRFGVETDRLPGVSTVQDLAFDGTNVLILTNGDTDFVTRVEPDGTHNVLPNPVTRDNTGYAMVWMDGELLVADTTIEEDGPVPYATRVLRHVDPVSGQILATSELPVEGWVTALAVAP